MTNGKLHVGFRLAPRSITLDDLELDGGGPPLLPRVAHRGIARFLRNDPKLNHVVPWSLHTFPENFM